MYDHLQLQLKTMATICCIGLVASLPIAAQDHPNFNNTLFSDPNYQEEMPIEWHTKPIVRDKLPADTDIAITLDQHLYPALLPLIQEYAHNHQLQIAVQEGTCGISARMLADKKADIGGFCCPPANSDRLPGLKYHTIGIAALAIIVHPNNAISNIDKKTIRDIFKGKLGYWGDISKDASSKLKDKLTRPIGRLHCKLRSGHWRLILDNEDQFSPQLHEVSTISDMLDQVARNQNSIGYEALWMANKYLTEGKVKTIAINSHNPQDAEALLNGDYPFYRTYNITTWTEKPASNKKADMLVKHLLQNIDKIDPIYGFISIQKLQAAGWQFKDNELVGTPH